MALIHRVRSARKVAGHCESCAVKIDVGMSYKWISVRPFGQINGVRRIRCEICDDWQEWEWNPSLASKCKKLAYETESTLRYGKHCTKPQQANAIMDETGLKIRVIANTRLVSAQRSEHVFGSINFKTRQFYEDVVNLRKWADSIAAFKAPRLPKPRPMECELCSAKGMDVRFGGDASCMECGGAGIYTPDTPGPEQLEEWRESVADKASGVLSKCPI